MARRIGLTSAADRVGVWALIGIGVASTVLYTLGISARYPLAVGLRSVRAGWSTLVERSLKVGLGFAGAIPADRRLRCGVRLVLRLRDHTPRRTIGIILVGWLLSSAALLGAYPGESFDIFDYVFRGRMIVEYGASPLATAPFVFEKSAVLRIHYLARPGGYLRPTLGICQRRGGVGRATVFGRADSLVAYIVGYRLMAVGLTGLCGLLIALIVQHARRSLSLPRYWPGSGIRWCWSPPRWEPIMIC